MTISLSSAQSQRNVIESVVHDPTFMGFRSLDEALDYQATFGGWVFEPEGVEEAIWFSPAMAPSIIMQHPATRGFSGRLLSNSVDRSIPGNQPMLEQSN